MTRKPAKSLSKHQYQFEPVESIFGQIVGMHPDLKDLTPRQGDLDGRGNLSQKALIEFIHWFLQVCLDQVNFMTSLFEFDRLAGHLKGYVENQGLKPEAFFILERVLIQGEMPRGEAERITGLKERSARMVLSSLINNGILQSGTPKGPVLLHFGSGSVEFLFPKLFTEN
jgi:Fic family protein